VENSSAAENRRLNAGRESSQAQLIWAGAYVDNYMPEDWRFPDWAYGAEL